jgi:hypothetical protein
METTQSPDLETRRFGERGSAPQASANRMVTRIRRDPVYHGCITTTRFGGVYGVGNYGGMRVARG